MALHLFWGASLWQLLDEDSTPPPPTHKHTITQTDVPNRHTRNRAHKSYLFETHMHTITRCFAPRISNTRMQINKYKCDSVLLFDNFLRGLAMF